MKCIATCDVHCSEGAWDLTSVLVMALCNWPEASASDLGDGQSCYLFCSYQTELRTDAKTGLDTNCKRERSD